MMKNYHLQCGAESGAMWIDPDALLCAQPEVHAEADSLRRQLQEMQSVLEGSDDAVFIWHPNAEPKPLNARATRWWEQADMAERAGLTAWVMDLPHTPGSVAESCMEWIAGGRKVLQARCVAQDSGTASGHRLYLRDVTEAHDIDRMKSEFLSAAAHELRTPLASIFGFTELMLVRQLHPDKQHELLGTIHRQSRSLIDLINELLDLSRIEARRGKDLRIASCSVAALVDGTLAGWHYKADLHALVCELPHGGCVVQADLEKTRQALLNVLSNAVKYSPQGGRVLLDSCLRRVGEQQQVGVRVTDQGIGMTAAQSARAFERFYRAHPLGDIPGTGLGLSLVKEIMQLQGGDAELDSVEGVGTEVTLWLPLQETSGMH
ncbi:MAG: HAMP domain-containing sensor histidine kinase [Rhodoferax sp.]|nr:HAMP domain-containing sensor histidine kinase [Rhodoferax sp.]